jgi:hypothetical protein
MLTHTYERGLLYGYTPSLSVFMFYTYSSCLSRRLAVQTNLPQEVEAVGGKESAEEACPPTLFTCHLPVECRKDQTVVYKEPELHPPQTQQLNNLLLLNTRRGSTAEQHSGTCLEHSTKTKSIFI